MGAVLRWLTAIHWSPKTGPPVRRRMSIGPVPFGNGGIAPLPRSDGSHAAPHTRSDRRPSDRRPRSADRRGSARDGRAPRWIVSFFKLGLWLIFAPGFDRLLEDLVAQGKKVFLDAKMFDIGETVKQGVARAAERGASFVTVHGDRDIIRAAVEGKRGSALRILAITALTSIDDDGARDLGHMLPVAELIRRRVAICAELGCDGVIASPHDVGDIRRVPGAEAAAGRDARGAAAWRGARRPQARRLAVAGDRGGGRLPRRRTPDRAGARSGRCRLAHHRRHEAGRGLKRLATSPSLPAHRRATRTAPCRRPRFRSRPGS